MNTPKHYDFAVLGGGSAGYAAARTAASLGLHTAVIDNATELGGLCILRGCMPSKTFIESANRNLAIRHAEQFGLKTIPPTPDIPTIIQRKRLLINDFASYRQQQLQDGRFDLIRAHASFHSATPDLLELSLQYPNQPTSTITASSVLIATGSTINTPHLPGLHQTGFWTSDTLLDADQLPDSFTVLGGGAIALELAHYLNGINRKVTLIQRGPQLLTGMDPDLAETIEASFKNRGIDVYTNTEIHQIDSTNHSKRVIFLDKTNGQRIAVENSEILVALGRKAATSSLNLPQAGITTNINGQINTQPTQLTSHPRVFAAGDASSPLEVVHLAIQQGEIAAKNAAAILAGKSANQQMDYRCILYGIFTEPQVAVVGLTETKAQQENIPYISASYPFNDHGKSMVMAETEGFVKLLADPSTGKLLGAAAIGPQATELTHQPAIAMHLHASAKQFLTAPWYHPTLSEIWSYPAEEIDDHINAPN